ncbi:NAD(P)/FAD-dependent oxidoreductase [Thermomonospora umbrina]|uniref:NAD/ferredoxin-dependent reductase-like protein n=1 Tax=Thermomonospora umbrina TaxID=111806 RepID=A0A3D9SYJ1_9ACTN|nr:FAD-dependent oxidoreductase [Thermomonospora umbrina]REF01033.1 NAD/ferredoxin-dependent reductase-like protein [Thermomonospora umbrina]
MPDPGVPRSVVVVGTGVAGATAALTLRTEGYDGRITLIGDEPHQPYRRPPLSKDVLTGGSAPERIRLRPPAAWRDQDIELLTGTSVTGFDASHVTLADGSRLGYDRLLLATGGRPRVLPHAAGIAGVHTLRTLDDAQALRADLEAAESLLVIGAGLVGLEVAASAHALGREVTVLEAADRPLERVLPTVLADAVTRLHGSRGIAIHTGVRLNALTRKGDTLVAEAADGGRWSAQVVLVAIGNEPQTRLAEEAGLQVSDGIVVDASGATSAPDVFAAGDVARYPDPLHGGSHRGEHWNHAQRHGAAVARAMLGHDAPYTEVPWCWTDQHQITLQMIGRPPESADLLVDGDPDGFDFTAVAHRDGTPVAAFAAGRPGDFRRLREGIGRLPAPS